MNFPCALRTALLLFLATTSSVAQVAVVERPAGPPHHEPNFETESAQADALFQQHKLLDALPLYEDLRKQDSTVALFAERLGACLLETEKTITDDKQRWATHVEAILDLRSAQALGDNSPFVRLNVTADSKTPNGAILAGIPLSVGYTYHGSAGAQPSFQRAETAFKAKDWSTALQSYTEAANSDPAWYDAALYAGDSCFRLKDTTTAGVWFARAIAVDPARETAYRYWGDALFQAGDIDGARMKFVDATVAEPYNNLVFSEIRQWAQRSRHQLVRPAIIRPPFTTLNGELTKDSALAASVQDGRSSWIVYQQYRVAHGARTLDQTVIAGSWDKNAVITPSGYMHTIAEEHAALRAMLSDLDSKLSAGTLHEADLDSNLRDIRNLERNNMLGAWIAINAADAGIKQDYPQYRDHHRKHLEDYVNTVLIR